MKRIGLVAGAVALGLAGVAVAQLVPTVPLLTNITPTDVLRVNQQGIPQATQTFANPPQLVAQMGYYKSAPSTGFTYTFGANVIEAMFRDTTTLSTGSITMPANPNDGQPACAFSKNIITTLTWSANTGQTLNDAVTTLAANGHACYVYSLSNATWDRSE